MLANVGGGVGAQRADRPTVLAELRERGQTIRPLCPYAAAYVREHPEVQDLVAR